MPSEDFTQQQVQDFETPPIPTVNPVEQIADKISDEKSVQNDLAEAKEVAEKDEYHGIKTTLFRQPDTGEKFKIPAVFSPNPLAENILSYLSNTGFVHILSIGQSGSGKTTWTKYLIHRLHELKNFQVHWYVRDEIQQLDKIIANLQKGISHIIVLDDASFTLEELPKDKVNEIAKKLTYIRHEVKSDVVVIMNIHYSKAIKKFFRSVPFTYLTSINMEEVNTFQDVFGGYSRYKLRDFSRYYQQMMLKGKWTIDLDKWNNKVQTYFTNKPFRIALANELNYLHFFYYSKNSCDICDPDYQTKRVVNTAELVNTMVGKYGKDRTRSMLFMYAFAKHGIKTMDSKRQSIWNTVADLDRNNPIDWNDVSSYLKKNMSKKRPRSYIKKSEYDKDYKDIKTSGTRKQTDEEIAVESAIESDFSKELKQNFDEMETLADKSLIMNNQSFGDENPIDFGNGLTDSDGMNPEGDDADQS
jgi:hypothetical protein